MTNAKDILKNAVVLFLITAVVAALLSGANLLTEERIEENKRLAEQKALSDVITAESFEIAQAPSLLELAQPVTGAYFAQTDGKTVGCCIKVAPSGFGGEMELIFGVSTDLTITGVSVLSHGETAGLGANITKEKFRSQFVGKKEITGVVKTQAKENEIQALSGATISSTAVTDGAKTALVYAAMLMQTPGLNQETEAVK